MKLKYILLFLNFNLVGYCKEITKITVLEITLEDCQKLSQEQEEYVFKLAKQLGINKKIDVFKMNPIKRTKNSRGAYTMLGKLFIDDILFKAPHEEFCSVVGKELIHIEKNHGRIKCTASCITLLLSIGLYNLLQKKLAKQYKSDFLDPIVKLLTASTIVGLNYLSYKIVSKLLDMLAIEELNNRRQ